MNFQEMNIKELQKNPFVMIGDEWMLVTAGNEEKANTMTASWGGLGVMWGKTVASVYIRPQRYTREFVEAQERFTLSFFDGAMKKEMGLLGSVSGRTNPDKISEAGLHLTYVDGLPTFEEAKMVLVLKKLYVQEMKEECFLGTEEIEKWYPDKDYHFMYMAEIEKAYVR